VVRPCKGSQSRPKHTKLTAYAAYHRSPTVAASYSAAIEAPSLPPSDRILVNLSGLKKPEIASLRKIVWAFGLRSIVSALGALRKQVGDIPCS
jgi:hypothetical protein